MPGGAGAGAAVAGSVVPAGAGAGAGVGKSDGNFAATDWVGDCWVAVPRVPPDAPDGIGEDVPASCESAIASAALTVLTV